MFQKKINELLADIPNVFGITDDIFIVGFDADGRDHDKRLEQVCRCRQANLRPNLFVTHCRLLQEVPSHEEDGEPVG